MNVWRTYRRVRRGNITRKLLYIYAAHLKPIYYKNNAKQPIALFFLKVGTILGLKYEAGLCKLLSGFYHHLYINVDIFPFYRNRYKSASFIVPVISFSFLYTLPKFFELRLEDKPIQSSFPNHTDALGIVSHKINLVILNNYASYDQKYY